MFNHGGLNLGYQPKWWTPAWRAKSHDEWTYHTELRWVIWMQGEGTTYVDHHDARPIHTKSAYSIDQEMQA